MKRARRRAVAVGTSWVDPFTRWFVSKGGVAQTSVLCLVAVALEVTRLVHDPNGLILMAILTVYSAVTQPALAYASQLGAANMEHILRQQDVILAELRAIMQDTSETLDEIEEHVGGESLDDIMDRLKEAGYGDPPRTP